MGSTYIHSTEYEFKHIYNINTLKNYCEYAERDIKRAEEIIRQIRKYQLELYNHVQDVLNTSTKYVVILNRSVNYSTNKKEYRVKVEVRPIVENYFINGNTIYGEYKEEELFQGLERHKAIRFAEEMAKKYRCEIEKTGNWRSK